MADATKLDERYLGLVEELGEIKAFRALAADGHSGADIRAAIFRTSNRPVRTVRVHGGYNSGGDEYGDQ